MHQLELEIEQERNMADNLVSAMQPDLRERYVQLKNQNMQFQVRYTYASYYLVSSIALILSTYFQRNSQRMTSSHSRQWSLRMEKRHSNRG